MNRARLVAYAQIALSILFLSGYFGVLVMFLTGAIQTPKEWEQALTALLGVITGSVTTIVAFWFSRSRNELSTMDDPNENLVR